MIVSFTMSATNPKLAIGALRRHNNTKLAVESN